MQNADYVFEEITSRYGYTREGTILSLYEKMRNDEMTVVWRFHKITGLVEPLTEDLFADVKEKDKPQGKYRKELQELTAVAEKVKILLKMEHTQLGLIKDPLSDMTCALFDAIPPGHTDWKINSMIESWEIKPTFSMKLSRSTMVPTVTLSITCKRRFLKLASASMLSLWTSLSSRRIKFD